MIVFNEYGYDLNTGDYVYVITYDGPLEPNNKQMEKIMADGTTREYYGWVADDVTDIPSNVRNYLNQNQFIDRHNWYSMTGGVFDSVYIRFDPKIQIQINDPPVDINLSSLSCDVFFKMLPDLTVTRVFYAFLNEPQNVALIQSYLTPIQLINFNICQSYSIFG